MNGTPISIGPINSRDGILNTKLVDPFTIVIEEDKPGSINTEAAIHWHIALKNQKVQVCQ